MNDDLTAQNDDRAAKAAALFASGLNCAQSVVVAFADELGLKPDDAARVALGLGGGVGRLREVCGTVTGAAMVLGARKGSDKAAAYAAIQDFAAAFKNACGAIVCRDLLAGTGASAGGPPDARTPDYYKKRPCVELVKLAARLLEGKNP